jgi:hypothetical protein
MLKLDLSLAPKWVDVGSGVRLFCTACTSTILAEARGAADVMAAAETGNQILVSHLFARHVARLVVRDWEGVGDAQGNAAPVTEDYVLALMEARQSIAERFAMNFVQPYLQAELEKNGSAASPNGTSAPAGRNTAAPATGSAKTARGTSTGRKR